MLLNWPEIQTRTFDFATFTRKEKPTPKPSGIREAVNEITEWLERAVTTRRPWRKDRPRSTTRRKTRSTVPVIRGELPCWFLRTAPRNSQTRRVLRKQNLRMILAGGSEAYKVKDLLRAKSIPVILRPTLTLPLEETTLRPSAHSRGTAAAGLDSPSQVLIIPSRGAWPECRQCCGLRPAYDEALRAVTITVLESSASTIKLDDRARQNRQPHRH